MRQLPSASLTTTSSFFQGRLQATPSSRAGPSSASVLPKISPSNSDQGAELSTTGGGLPASSSSNPYMSSHVATGGVLGLMRARDTGNSPSRTRLATPLSSSYREAPFHSPVVLQTQFSATGPFSNAMSAPRASAGSGIMRKAGTGVVTTTFHSVASSMDTALSGSMAHAILHKDALLPPLYVPPIDVPGSATPTCGLQATASASTNTTTPSAQDSAVPPSPTGASSSGAPVLQHRGAVTIVFDLDETLCNNRRPGKALLRPHTMELLHHLNNLRNDPSVNCYVELVLWTASMECVARPVVERMDPSGSLFQHLIYRDRRWYRETGYTKDLKRLGREMHHTVIIENSPASVHLNRKHSILVRDFVSGPDGELLVVRDVLDGWIRAVGACARTLQAPPPNDPTSPSSIVRFLSDHPSISAGNEVIRSKIPPADAPNGNIPKSNGGFSVGGTSLRSSSSPSAVANRYGVGIRSLGGGFAGRR